MMIIECDCGKQLEMPEGFLEGGAFPLWKAHGHFPNLIIYRCPCGAKRESGPDAEPDASDARASDRIWYKKHQKCQSVALGAN